VNKLAAMGTFVRIVERGSLTAAAAALDTSLPSVVRTLAALERDLGRVVAAMKRKAVQAARQMPLSDI